MRKNDYNTLYNNRLSSKSDSIKMTAVAVVAVENTERRNWTEDHLVILVKVKVVKVDEYYG